MMKEAVMGYLILSQHLPDRSEETMENFSQDS
jgi:hypothetical protein